MVLHVLAAAGIVAFSGTAKATILDFTSAGPADFISDATDAGTYAADQNAPTYSAPSGQVVGAPDGRGHYFIGHSSISAGHFSPFVGGFPRFVATDFSDSDLRAIASTLFYAEPDLTLSPPML